MIERARILLRRRLARVRSGEGRLSIPWFGLGVGALVGALYSLQSAQHMVVGGAHDKLVVGALLVGLAALIGWLAGLLLLAEPETSPNPGSAAPERDGARESAGEIHVES